jgi:dTDP-6-deoxy-L-talose 4-dehydrogenase (NAD+)
MSGGEQLRDYLPAAEVARHLVSLAIGGKDPGIVNICSGKPVSIRSLVEGWIAENGWSIDLNRGLYPYPDYEPMAFWGDRQKMDRCLQAGMDR